MAKKKYEVVMVIECDEEIKERILNITSFMKMTGLCSGIKEPIRIAYNSINEYKRSDNSITLLGGMIKTEEVK